MRSIITKAHLSGVKNLIYIKNIVLNYLGEHSEKLQAWKVYRVFNALIMKDNRIILYLLIKI